MTPKNQSQLSASERYYLAFLENAMELPLARFDPWK